MGTGNLELGLREFGLGPRVDWSRENQEARDLGGPLEVVVLCGQETEGSRSQDAEKLGDEGDEGECMHE